MAGCPRCRQTLVENQVDEFTVRLCVPCKGILLPHADLVKILDRSWLAVSPEAAEQLEFRAPEGAQAEQPYRCPACDRMMEKYGYMGLAAIRIDRCDTCSLVWLDADELQNMILALARSNYRSDRARRREWEEQTHDYVSVGMVSFGGARGESWVFGNSRTGAGLAVALVLLRLL